MIVDDLHSIIPPLFLVSLTSIQQEILDVLLFLFEIQIGFHFLFALQNLKGIQDVFTLSDSNVIQCADGMSWLGKYIVSLLGRPGVVLLIPLLRIHCSSIHSCGVLIKSQNFCIYETLNYFVITGADLVK